MRYLQFVALLLFVIACTTKQENTTTDADSENSSVSNQGVEISYDRCGKSEQTLVFVHGWGIDRSYWDDQVKYFCDQYEVINLDLPGFGKSGKNRENFDIETYASDLSALISQLKLEQVILIGHSMSGNIILETAIQKEDEVIGLVGVDNFKSVGTSYTPAQRSQIDQFLLSINVDFVGTVNEYMENSLIGQQPDTLLSDRLRNSFSSMDTVAGKKSLKSVIDYEREAELLSKLDQKLYLINSSSSPTYTNGLDSVGVDYEVYEIDAYSHYPMNEKPDEFNKLLEKAILEIVANN